jgi:type I restriction enzyme S subunit
MRKHTKDGFQIKSTKLYKVSQADFIYNRLFAWKRSFAEVNKNFDACYVPNDFPCFEIDTNLIVPGYLWAYFAQPEVWDAIENMSSGTFNTSRLRFNEKKLKKMPIPVPPHEVQTPLAKMWIDYLHIENQLQDISHKI